jgi:uncharacterized protein (TIGR02453 family)
MNEFFIFLKELKENNNREWFHENKQRYDALHKEFVNIVQQMIERISVFDKEIIGLEAKNCIFRIYRDIRFSSDKTPYKTHFGAYMAGLGGRTSPYGGYYLHIEPDNSLLSGGTWCPTPQMVKQLRKDIYDNANEFLGIMEDRKFKKLYGGLDGETLKKIPEGFPKDLPEKVENILKHKNFIVYCDKPDSFFDSKDWLDKAVDDFKILYPFNQFLNYTIKELLNAK